MRYRTLFAVSFCCMDFVCCAQKLELGVFAGGGLSRLFNERASDFYAGLERPAAVAMYGLRIHYTHPSRLGIGAEIAHMPVVQRYGHDEYSGKIKNTAEDRVCYLDVPVLLRYSFRSGAFLESGPKLSLTTGARSEINRVTFPEKHTAVNTKRSYRRQIVSYAVGVGASRQLNNFLSVTGSVRAAVALTDGVNKLTREEYFDLLRRDEASHVLHHAYYRAGTSLPMEYTRTTPVTLHVLAGLGYNFHPKVRHQAAASQ